MDTPTALIPAAWLAPIEGAAAWRNDGIAARGWWPRRLTSAEIAGIDAALAHAQSRGKAPPRFGAEGFPADPALRALLHDVAEELEHGGGIVRLSGLPVDRYPMPALKALFWGLCANLGTPLIQTHAGEVLAEVKDETGQGLAVTGGGPGPVPSARMRSRSTGPLRWHTDKCDILALLCASNGIAGGVSRVVSTVAIQNEIARRRPDLLALLYEDYWRMRPGDEEGARDGEKVFAMPVFARGPNGDFTSQYSRTYVEMAQEVPGVPRLTAAQNEALDMIRDIGEALCAEAPFTPGDIQLINNHVCYHGRTAYADDLAAGAQRVLLRIWLSAPNSRALPPGHAGQWGDTRPGALRGGAVLCRSAIAA
ncbi:MAG: TauD/TfdA family dioxygenase [Acetobacteraceae bacterium]|nr:TauD/TfdA family dioxygenase [Acetobacteraceae bacterium]